MPGIDSHWTLLIISLPSHGASTRIRVWRTLKALGSAALRDGAYLLPQQVPQAGSLAALADETRQDGGNAWVLTVQSRSESENNALRALFDRARDYTDLMQSMSNLQATLADLAPQDIGRQLRKLRRDYDAIRAIDYFPGEMSIKAEAAWKDFAAAAAAVMSPGEPRPERRSVERLDPALYQQRLWATRRHLWVDRVASAWLIRRFIDRDARFVWLETPEDGPDKALGFDFDGAAFTHVGDLVTFEVLMASFGLEQDLGLRRIAAIVHALDVGGAPVPEASGFEAVLAGTRQRTTSDDQLLAEIGVVLDSLHAHFSNNAQT